MSALACTRVASLMSRRAVAIPPALFVALVSACSLAAPSDAELTAGLAADGGARDDGAHHDADPDTSSCQAAGNACSAAEGQGCCSGLTCAQARCVTTLTCAASGDSCVGAGQAMCCSGLACTRGQCGAAPTCTPPGGACSRLSSCCSGACTPNHTCP